MTFSTIIITIAFISVLVAMAYGAYQFGRD